MVQEGHITTINTLLYSIEEQTIEMHGKVKILLGRCFEDPLSWWYKILLYNAQILFSVISSWFCPLEDFFFPHYLLWIKLKKTLEIMSFLGLNIFSTSFLPIKINVSHKVCFHHPKEC